MSLSDFQNAQAQKPAKPGPRPPTWSWKTSAAVAGAIALVLISFGGTSYQPGRSDYKAFYIVGWCFPAAWFAVRYGGLHPSHRNKDELRALIVSGFVAVIATVAVLLMRDPVTGTR